MGRKSLKKERRSEIINAFYEVAKDIGLENASVAKVASHLDINPSLIIHYFQTREELLLGLIEFTLDRYRGMFVLESEPYPTIEGLQRLVGDLFTKKWNELFDDGVFYSCYALSYRDDRIKKSFQQLHDSLREMLAEALNFYKDDGIIEIEDTEELAGQIFILVEGAYYYLGMIEDKDDYQRKLDNYKTLALNLIAVTLV